MCGICGFVGFRDRDLLQTMTTSLMHRGLDDVGYYEDALASLGFRRLSIIDLATGNQPLANEDQTVWSVCNGEIYNFAQIKERLIEKGHLFRTKTDTEVIVHAYEEAGMDFVSWFNGMFAIALWDKKLRTLYLIRDRIGKKPLHYYVDANRLLFASEIKALLRYPSIDKELDFAAISDYLSFRYPPGNASLFKKITSVPPAHVLTFKEGSVASVWPYWRLCVGERQKSSEQECVSSFRGLFETSVKRRLMSDVPLGIYLSGGLDSSVVAALVKKFYPGELVVFSHGFDLKDDERKYARLVAKYLSARHLEVEIREEHLDLLPEIIYHMDMPIANSDIVGFFLLAKLARQHVKVILTGEGADELFGSYVHQELIYHGWRFKRFFPRPFLKGAASPLVEHMPMRLLNKFFRYPGYALDEESKRKLVEYVSSPDLAGDYFSLNALFSPYEKDALFSPEFRERFASESGPRMDMRSILSDGDIPDVLSKLIFLEFQYWLPTYHLVKEDKISMSQCIEQRFPFLDYELVEYVAGLPNRFKLSGLVRKAVLRKAAEDLLPSEIVWRPKGPILVPINKCFAKRFLIMVKDILSQEAVQRRGYFRYAYIQKLIQGREANPFLYDRQLFALLALEIWHRIFVDKGGVR